MKKIFSAMFALVAVVLLSACGGKKDNSDKSEYILKPVETEVGGDMDGCFKVVDKEYKVTEGIFSVITIEVERLDKELPFKLNGRELWSFSMMGAGSNVQVGFGIEFLDKDGNVVEKTDPAEGGMGGPYDADECVTLAKLKPGKKATIRFSVRGNLDEIVGFRLSSAYKENGYSSSDSSMSDEEDADDDDESSSSLSSSSSSSEDWDAVLDSYEKYVNKYIALAKNAVKGDASALSEYPSLMEEAQELGEKLQNAQGELSASQVSRYTRITNKMATAAQGL